jgi:hypothetical protein
VTKHNVCLRTYTDFWQVVAKLLKFLRYLSKNSSLFDQGQLIFCQFVLDSEILAGRGAATQIIITQPRRSEVNLFSFFKLMFLFQNSCSKCS